MEVYTPIPESALPHAPRPVRLASRVVLAAVLVFGVWKVADFTDRVDGERIAPRFSGPIANKSIRFGVVETRFGPALAECGGEGGLRCGEGTTLVFATCSHDVRDYFWSGADQDVRARELIAEQPPTGDAWEFGGCWWSGWGAFPFR